MSTESGYGNERKIAAGLKRKKILVMDDEEIVRDVVGMMLDKLGYDVSLSQDGDEAIEQYLKAPGESFDAVIVDLNIKGGMGGIEVCSRLREIDPSVTCIASSGYTIDLDALELEKYGFKGAIAKPYRLARLDSVLKNVL